MDWLLHSWDAQRFSKKFVKMSRLLSSFLGLLKKRNRANFGLKKLFTYTTELPFSSVPTPYPKWHLVAHQTVRLRSWFGKNICVYILRQEHKCSCCHWAASQWSDYVQGSQCEVTMQNVWNSLCVLGFSLWSYIVESEWGSCVNVTSIRPKAGVRGFKWYIWSTGRFGKKWKYLDSSPVGGNKTKQKKMQHEWTIANPSFSLFDIAQMRFCTSLVRL